MFSLWTLALSFTEAHSWVAAISRLRSKSAIKPMDEAHALFV
jgi:hypothetical protein